ncbi:hypothetical protein EK21DRAFT_112331 [Setomelanomma holmii]|uniref:Zn(2)-C6 fungal-type domain-containing protein n=1 Tax=Setomelanomma holmii TaxID=210430 RepID=A0A9P4H8F6_9PLEO|nr:hypothetical protein EK21DRAFT_112331 [Setomelanomma holmii]
MSQRSRPGSSQVANDPQRMPFEAAEALLWGKETLHQQEQLYGRMRELESHNRGYESRIQSTEAIAEAAEAAISRIRDIEQKVIAIESDERDRPFDKWVEGEIESFKVFTEKNKNVRQKQIELERQVAGIEDHIDKVKDTSRDVEILLERIGRLEADRIKDADTIKKLERDVTNLTLMRQRQPKEVHKVQPKAAPKQHGKQTARPLGRSNGVSSHKSRHTLMEDRFAKEASRQEEREQVPPPPSRQGATGAPDTTSYIIDRNDPQVEITRRSTPEHMRPPPLRQQKAVDSETEDEDFIIPHDDRPPAVKLLHAPRSPEVKQKSSSSTLVSSPSKGRDDMSARFRMMQRKSIHDPKKSREVEAQQPKLPTTRSRVQNNISLDQLPPTQIVDRSDVVTPVRGLDSPTRARNVRSSGTLPPTQIASRLKAISPARAQEPTSRTLISESPTQLIVKLKTGKRKLEEDVFSPRLTRSQVKKNNEVVRVQPEAVVKKATPIAETQLAPEPATKRRKPNNPRMPPDRLAGEQQEVKVAPRAALDAAASPVRTSPRKAAVAVQQRSCNSCRLAKTRCDKKHPVCGNCKKHPQRGPCVYSKPPIVPRQPPAPTLSAFVPTSPRKKANGKGQATPAKAGDGFQPDQDEVWPSSKTLSLAKSRTAATPANRFTNQTHPNNGPRTYGASKASSSRAAPRVPQAPTKPPLPTLITPS